MFDKSIYGIAFLLANANASTSTAVVAVTCMPMGGVATVNLYPEGKGGPILISATMFGTLSQTAGKITAQRKTATGLEMDM